MVDIQKRLDGTRSDTIEIRQLRNIKGFRSILFYCINIRKASSKDLTPFYQLRVDRLGSFGMPPYYLFPLYQKYEKNSAYFYLIILIESDRILILLKNVHIAKGQYVRMIGKPISIQNNQSHEDEIIEVLINNKLINQIFFVHREAEDIASYDLEFEKKIRDRDYFSYIRFRFQEIDKARYKSRNIINKIKLNNDIEFRNTTSKDIANIKNLDLMWKNYKQKGNERIITPKFLDNLLNDIKNKKIISYVYYYKKRLCGVEFLLSVMNDTQLLNVAARSIGRAEIPKNYFEKTEKRDPFINVLKRKTVYQMFYFMLKSLKDSTYRNIYSAGGGGLKKGVMLYKEYLNHNSIDYLSTIVFNK